MSDLLVFACDTPLQILNAVILKEGQFSQCVADLYIYNQFSTAEIIFEKIQNVNVFRNVFLIDKYKEYPSGLQKIATLKRMLFPLATLKKYALIGPSPKREPYTTIVFSFINAFFITVYGINKTKEFIQLEDGVGTYMGDCLNDYLSGMFKTIIKKTRYKKITQPQEVAIYNLEMYKGPVNTIKLDSNLGNELFDKIEYIFDYRENDLYTRNRYVYMTQPFEEAQGYSVEKYEDTKKVLESYKNELLLRVHPRENLEKYKGFTLDEIRNLWELECTHQIDDNNVLIGIFSTAQLMPKILQNKEPYIIFLYKVIFQKQIKETREEWDRFVDLFKSFYQKPEKIYVPRNIEEFQEILSNVVKGEIYENQKG